MRLKICLFWMKSIHLFIDKMILKVGMTGCVRLESPKGVTESGRSDSES